MSYKNGQIPEDKLVCLGDGRNGDGYFKHLLPPGTAQRWRALVAEVKEREGVTLTISPGWNGYRPLQPQKDAKAKYGRNAAAPGESSHGGTFEGRDAMAIDVGNYGAIGEAKFFAYARKHGFTAGYFNGQQGRPKEPWHIIDFAPWAEEEDEMNADIEQMIRDIRTTQLQDSKTFREGTHPAVVTTAQRVASMHAGNFLAWDGTGPGGTLEWLDEKLAATAAAITTAILTATPGSGHVDPEEVRAAVRAGVQEALQSIETTITVKTE